jgi:hypothetical protein
MDPNHHLHKARRRKGCIVRAFLDRPLKIRKTTTERVIIEVVDGDNPFEYTRYSVDLDILDVQLPWFTYEAWFGGIGDEEEKNMRIALRQLLEFDINVGNRASRVFLMSAMCKKKCTNSDGQIELNEFRKEVKTIASYEDLFNPGGLSDEKQVDANISLFAKLPVDRIIEIPNLVSYYCY